MDAYEAAKRGFLDEDIIPLVDVINYFVQYGSGLRVVKACSGHDNPIGQQMERGRWYVYIKFSDTENGKLTFDFFERTVSDSRSLDISLIPWNADTFLLAGTVRPGEAATIFEVALGRWRHPFGNEATNHEPFEMYHHCMDSLYGAKVGIFTAQQ